MGLGSSLTVVLLATSAWTTSSAAPLHSFAPSLQLPAVKQGQSSSLKPKLRPHPALNPAQTQAAIAELRTKQLLMPIQGVNPETLKGSYYQKRGNELHHAVDILAPRNTPILAVEDGTIAKLFLSKAGGNTIYEFDPSGKYIYYYAHLQRYAADLHNGDAVKRGQIVGYVGTSGDAPPNTPHLHFEISKVITKGNWWISAPIDPYEVLRGSQPSGAPLKPQPAVPPTGNIFTI